MQRGVFGGRNIMLLEAETEQVPVVDEAEQEVDGDSGGDATTMATACQYSCSSSIVSSAWDIYRMRLARERTGVGGCVEAPETRRLSHDESDERSCGYCVGRGVKMSRL